VLMVAGNVYRYAFLPIPGDEKAICLGPPCTDKPAPPFCQAWALRSVVLILFGAIGSIFVDLIYGIGIVIGNSRKARSSLKVVLPSIQIVSDPANIFERRSGHCSSIVLGSRVDNPFSH